VVAYNMSEWHAFVGLLKGPKSDVIVLLATFTLTVAVDLVVAIQVGVVLAALLFMRRMADVTEIKANRELVEYETGGTGEKRTLAVPEGVEVFEISGSFSFGAARKFTETVLSTRRSAPVMILRMRHVLAMDATGLHALEDVYGRLRKSGTVIILSGINAQPLEALKQSGLFDKIGAENVRENFTEALKRAAEFQK
jgi:SulP family sulfate permease